MSLHFEISQHFLDEPAQRAGFILLGAFLASFLFIRTSARMIRSPKFAWWPGSVTTDSGLHLHHLVWGIVLLLLSGFLNFALGPTGVWLDVLAALFGIGAGLDARRVRTVDPPRRRLLVRAGPLLARAPSWSRC